MIKQKIRKLLSKIKQALKPGDYLPNAANNEALEKLRDIHKGKRAFILGNGPSLTVDDMNLLKNEITFASNKIYLAYDQTDWRPTYYTLADEIVAQNNVERIERGELGGQAIFNSSVHKYFKNCKRVIFVNPPSLDGDEAFDAVAGFRAGNSILNFDLKLAYFMGIREVYVLGCDHSFEDKSVRTGKKVAGNEIIVSEGEQNHFHPEYRKKGETWTVPKMDLIEGDFSVAAEKYNQAGGTVYNASRKTALEIWPQVRLEEIL